MSSLPDVVVALAGPLAAGKTTLARYLVQSFDFAEVTSRKILERELQASGAIITRAALQELGQRVQDQRGELWMTDQIVRLIPSGKATVIDAVRHVESVRCLRATLGTRLKVVFVTAAPSTRRARFLAR